MKGGPKITKCHDEDVDDGDHIFYLHAMKHLWHHPKYYSIYSGNTSNKSGDDKEVEF
jgi:hypothetical protein